MIVDGQTGELASFDLIGDAGSMKTASPSGKPPRGVIRSPATLIFVPGSETAKGGVDAITLRRAYRATEATSVPIFARFSKPRTNSTFRSTSSGRRCLRLQSRYFDNN